MSHIVAFFAGYIYKIANKVCLTQFDDIYLGIDTLFDYYIIITVNYPIIALIHIPYYIYYAYICHTTQKHTPEYTLVPPPRERPTVGATPSPIFFIFIFYFQICLFHIHCLSSILFSTRFKPF